jgi:catechol-2,3-dioxygenase
VAWLTDAEGFQLAPKHLASLGVHFGGPLDHGQSHSIYFADPDGNPLEITYYLAPRKIPDHKLQITNLKRKIQNLKKRKDLSGGKTIEPYAFCEAQGRAKGLAQQARPKGVSRGSGTASA